MWRTQTGKWHHGGHSCNHLNCRAISAPNCKLSNALTEAAAVRGQIACRSAKAGHEPDWARPAQTCWVHAAKPAQSRPATGYPAEPNQGACRSQRANSASKKSKWIFFRSLPHQKKVKKHQYSDKKHQYLKIDFLFSLRRQSPQRERVMGNLCGAEPPHHATGQVAEIWSVSAFACWEADRPAIKRGMGVLELKERLWQPGGMVAHDSS